MFHSDKLIYIQMQKSASSHIASLLPNFFEGTQIKKHNAASDEMIASHPYFVSSIRNPWDWYLSLWTFGVQGDGAIRNRLIKGATFKRMLSKPTISHYLKLKKDAEAFRSLYKDRSDTSAFRTWLKMALDPKNSYLYQESYSECSDICGLLTFRYMKLCCQHMNNLPLLRSLKTQEDLAKFDQQNCYINFFVRQESLEDELCQAIEKVRPLTTEEKDIIYGAKKTNTSKRSLALSDYYDDECIELVQNRDQLIVDKFNYSFPSDK